MPKQRFTTEEIIHKLHEADVWIGQGKTVADACKQLGITDKTYFRWRKSHGGLRIDQAKRMRELEAENARLKKAVAELTVDKIILKEVAEGNLKPDAAAGSGGLGTIPASLLGAPDLPRVGHTTIEHPVRAGTKKRRRAPSGVDRSPGGAVWAVRLSADRRPAGARGLVGQPLEGRADLEAGRAQSPA